MECEFEQAKRFWASLDVDVVFDELMELLTHLRCAIREHTATDRELVLAMNLSMEADLNLSKIQGIQDLLINEDILAVTVSEVEFSPERLTSEVQSREHMPGSSHSLHVTDTCMVSAAESPLIFHPHECSAACLSHSPAHTLPAPTLNPLQAPVLHHFRRYCEAGVVTYGAQCGRVLSCMEDVFQFLSQTEILEELQPENFSFDPQVNPKATLDVTPVSALFEHDLSQGVECVPVSVCNTVDSTRLEEFVYRRERWPHGCFLTSAPLFSVCCNCTDACSDPQHCECVRRTLRSAGGGDGAYTHQRLRGALRSGLWECGPWCVCNRLHCQNRVVQRGLRVRLQIFRTPEHRWSVRCIDDIEAGTFICIYAGVVHRLQSATVDSSDLQDPALSGDDVELVEELTLPIRPKESFDSSLPSLHVSVIQNPAQQKVQLLVASKESESSLKPEQSEQRSRKRLWESSSVTGGTYSPEKGYYLDASREGNVARFLKQSEEPNLFVQNVFTDTHDPHFPLLAFFSCWSLKAGTELSWNSSHTPELHS